MSGVSYPDKMLNNIQKVKYDKCTLEIYCEHQIQSKTGVANLLGEWMVTFIHSSSTTLSC